MKVLKFFQHLEDEYNFSMLCAGVSFYLLWAAIPSLYLLLQIIVSSNIISSSEFISYILENVPESLHEHVYTLLTNKVTVSKYFIVFVIISTLYSSSKGMRGIIKFNEIIYQKKVADNKIKLIVYALFFTLGIFILFILLISIVLGVVGIFDNFADYQVIHYITSLLRFFLLPATLFVLILLILTYTKPKKSLIKNNIKISILVTTCFIVFSNVFIIYVKDISKYSTLYGPFQSFLMLFLWIYSLTYILLLGIILSSKYLD